jgi:hypothetical protein
MQQLSWYSGCRPLRIDERWADPWPPGRRQYIVEMPGSVVDTSLVAAPPAGVELVELPPLAIGRIWRLVR